MLESSRIVFLSPWFGERKNEREEYYRYDIEWEDMMDLDQVRMALAVQEMGRGGGNVGG